MNRHLIPTLDSDHTLRQIQEPLFPPKIGKKRAIFAQIDDHSSQQSACVQVRVSQLFLKLRRVVGGCWAGGPVGREWRILCTKVHKQYIYVYYTLRRMQCNFRPSTRICNVAHGTGDTLALACHAIDPQWFVAKIWQKIIVVNLLINPWLKFNPFSFLTPT